MAGYDPDAQTIFDGLLRFALANPSPIDHRLMLWHVPVTAESGADSAFDGDADIAYGLMLAHAQWGANGAYNYNAFAHSWIDGIMASTIGPQSRLPMLGDWVEPNGDPHNQDSPRSSDFMPGHFRAWARFTGNLTWDTVASNCASLINVMQATHAPTTGLLPDFIQFARTDPKPAYNGFLEVHDDAFYYNACRDPWRLAVDALINGNALSREQAVKMTEWARVKTSGNPEAIRAGYKLDGSNISGNNYFSSNFVSPMAVAALLDPAHAAWLESLYESVRVIPAQADTDYFEDTITLMCLLVVSGDFWDPTLPPVAPHLVQQPVNIVTQVGKRVMFTASAAGGLPPLRYQWFHNTKPISGATTRTYTIASVTKASAGAYDVVITGKNGKSTTSRIAKLTVN